MKIINQNIIFSKGYNPKTVFITDYNAIEGRLDPLFYSGAILGFLENIKYPLKTISEISDYVKSGFAVGKEAQADDDVEKYIHIRPTNISDEGELKFNKNVYIGAEYLESKKDQILQFNDVLFNNTNSQEWVGKTTLFNTDGIYFSSNHITRIKSKPSIVLPEYLCWVLNFYQTNKVFFNICTNWNNQSGIGSEQLKKIKIPVPPIEIQKKIVSKISETIRIRTYAKSEFQKQLNSIDNYLLGELGITLPVDENNIENRIFIKDYKTVNIYNRLNPSFYHYRITEIKKIINLKWNSCLNDVISEIYRYPTFYDISYQEEGIPVIKGESISDIGFINPNQSFDYIDKITHEKFIKTELVENDLILTVRGFIGKVGIFKNIANVGNINANVIKIRVKSNVIPEFLMFYLNSILGRLIIDNISTGQVQKTITVPEILKIPIPLPEINIQKNIVNKISEIFKNAQNSANGIEESNSNLINEIETILK